MKKILLLIIFSALIISCGKKPKEPSDDIPVAALSIFPLYEAASNIAGNRVELINLLPPGTDPHNFEPRPSAAMKLREADLCIIISDHFDGWMKSYLSEKTKVLKLTDSHNHEQKNEQGHNPHIWLYPPDMINHLEKIKNAFIEISPENRKYFNERFNKYSSDLEQLDSTVRDMFSKFDSPRVTQWHPAWNRFCEGYNIEIISTIERGHSQQAGLKRIKESVNTAKQSGSRVVILDPRSNPDASESFIKAIDGVPAFLDPIGGRDNLRTYKMLIMHNAKALAEAFTKAEEHSE